ncbi:MFS transporter [Roseicitreum antarcticum]|uniref:Fucose permease n=1 Tax=Roseicitreum antarcticum TaxID=564137 RepID=A0A1H2TG63_9RHOB|nr:MFS transporter [Roseicitreum antarcticum]SDW42963.1 Fucose permease [Roseicitreum antarcticum]
MSDAIMRSKPLWADTEWRAVVAAFALNGLLFGAWAARVPAFKERFDLEPGMLGLLLLALAGGAIASFPLAGALSERWGAPKLTILCAWIYAPALVLLAFAPVPLALAAALFIFGAMHGSMDVAMNGWGAQVETRTARSTMSVFHAMFSLGAGLGAASGFVAVRMGLGPEMHFITVALFGGTAALAAMLCAQRTHTTYHDDGTSQPLVALPSGTLFLVGLIAFAVSMGEGAMADWSAVFLAVAAAATEAQAALGYAIFSAAMVLTRLGGGVLEERFGAVATVRASAAIAFCGLTTAIVGQEVPTILIGFALTGVGYAVVMPLVFSRAARDPDVPPGPAIASVATLGYGGMLLGPPVIGFIAQLTGMRLSFIALAALAILAALLAPKLTVKA